MRDLDELFTALARSTFRSRFRLGAKETSYLKEKTLAVVLEHGRRFVVERLADEPIITYPVPALADADGRILGQLGRAEDPAAGNQEVLLPGELVAGLNQKMPAVRCGEGAGGPGGRPISSSASSPGLTP
jgi:hypothetical protein